MAGFNLGGILSGVGRSRPMRAGHRSGGSFPTPRTYASYYQTDPQTRHGAIARRKKEASSSPSTPRATRSYKAS